MNWWHVLEICACVPKTCLRGWALATRRARGTVWQAHAFSPRRGATTASIKIPCWVFDLRLSLTKGVRLFHARWSILAKSCLVNSHGLKVRKIREAQLNKGIVDMVAEQLLRLHFFWLLWVLWSLHGFCVGFTEQWSVCDFVKWGSGFSKRTAQRDLWDENMLKITDSDGNSVSFWVPFSWSTLGTPSIHQVHLPSQESSGSARKVGVKKMEAGKGPWGGRSLGGQYVAMLLNRRAGCRLDAIKWMVKKCKRDFWSGCRLKVRKDRQPL